MLNERDVVFQYNRKRECEENQETGLEKKHKTGMWRQTITRDVKTGMRIHTRNRNKKRNRKQECGDKQETGTENGKENGDVDISKKNREKKTGTGLWG